MLQSKEIRWFSRRESPAICNWFAQRGLTFDSTSARTDYYLVSLDQDHIAPKLREGRIEIKHRIGHPIKYQLKRGVDGYLEDWIKWSFRLDNDDGTTQQIMQGNPYPANWLAVRKQRLGVKLDKGVDENLKVHDLTTVLAGGCQVEYTHVTVNGQEWFTFNLEWFGDDFLTLPSSFFAALLGDSTWPLAYSMGYGQFLQQLRV